MKKFFSLALGLVSLIGVASAQQIPVLDFFHGRECPHCQNEKKWFPTLKQAYPDIVINEYEVWHDPANQALMQKRLSELNQESSSVPTNIIGDQVVVGFSPDRILAALAAKYGDPAVDIATLDEAESADEESNYLWLILVIIGLGIGGLVAFTGKKS